MNSEISATFSLWGVLSLYFVIALSHSSSLGRFVMAD